MADRRASNKTRIRRAPERAIYDRSSIYDIVDEALWCHVGFTQNGQPFMIPTIHARDGDNLLLHGATSSRLIKHVQEGHELCVAITLLDGLVLARSVYHHTMNYRSAVLFGKGKLVEGGGERLEALKTISEHVMPGRWDDARGPNKKEMLATAVVSIAIDEASAKVRTGPPNDDQEDYQLPVWAGVLPTRQQFLLPEEDPRSVKKLIVPEYLKNYHR